MPSLTWDEIHDWHDRFDARVTAEDYTIRGIPIAGSNLQTWERGEVWLELELGFVGNTQEERLYDFARSTLAARGNLEVRIPYERFERIVRGEDHLADDEFLYYDEWSEKDTKDFVSRHRLRIHDGSDD